MGQKVNPHGFRVGVIYDWDAPCFSRYEKENGSVVDDEVYKNQTDSGDNIDSTLG